MPKISSHQLESIRTKAKIRLIGDSRDCGNLEHHSDEHDEYIKPACDKDAEGLRCIDINFDRLTKIAHYVLSKMKKINQLFRIRYSILLF